MRLLRRLPRLLQLILSVFLLLLLFMTLYRFVFFFHYRPSSKPFSGSAFLLGLRYDLKILSIASLFLIIAGGLPFLNPFKSLRSRKIWVVLLCIIFLTVILFYGSDYYYYDYLKQRLNASILNFAEDASISANMMWQTYPVIPIVLVLFILTFLFGYWANKRIKALERLSVNRQKKKQNKYYYAAAILLLALASFGKLGQYPLRWSDAFAFGDDFKASTALNPFQSFFSSLTFRKSGYDIKQVRDNYGLMADYLGVAKQDSLTLNYTRDIEFADTFVRKPNIVIVICESFSAYKSSMFGNKLNPTPYFNELCRQGTFFERCFTPAFGTARGVWAVITGIPDVEDPKTASRNPAAVNQHTIINNFKSYDKFYFLGGSTTWANIRGLLNNNIDSLQIFEEENFSAKKVDVWGISDKNLFLEATKILGKQQRPFISIIQTADNHRPYTIPTEDQNAFKTVSYPADTLKKYGFEDNGQLNAFRYTDFCFRAFMEAAKKEKFFNNTVFVFVGDHGLRGDAGSMFPQSFTRQGILAEHVPLLFLGAGLPPQRIINVCSQLDILPSVAALAKQPYRNTAFGRNLFDSTNKKEHYAFIADPDLRTIGLVSDNYYYAKSLNTGKIDFVSVTNNDTPSNDSAKAKMAGLTNAWYQTAKYLLLNNRKEK